MRVQNILMVEPKAPAGHVYSRFALPRLGLPLLGTIAQEKGFNVKVVVEDVAPLDSHGLLNTDLLCISTITPTAQSAYALADFASQRNIPVILGGSHPTALPDEALEHADWVIRGEAEETFPLFLDALVNETDLSVIPGLSYKDQGEIIHNPQAERPKCLDSLPFPDFDLIEGQKDGTFPLGIIPVMTSRGCPHKCRFCSVTPVFGHKMRFASNESVAKELERHRGKGNLVFFYDDNFCASPKRTKSLLRYLMDNGIYLPPWIAQVSVRAARDVELLELMQQSGCHTVFIGFESIDNNALELYKKRQEVDDIRKAIRRFHDHNIGVHGMFVFGSDAEGHDTIRKTAKFVLEEDIESVQFMILTPYPGTPLFEDMEQQGRLLTKNWSMYDAHHAVFQPSQMSIRSLMDETFTAFEKVYSLRRQLRFLFKGRVQRAFIARYAASQVRKWRVENKELMKELKKAEENSSSPALQSVFDHFVKLRGVLGIAHENRSRPLPSLPQ